MTATEIEKRLSLLEQEMANLKAERAATPPANQHPAQALEATHGSFQDDNALKEAMRLGRKWRTSLDRQSRRKPKAKRK